jgi:hypothetical protein
MTYRQEAAIKKSVGRVGCISFQFFSTPVGNANVQGR